MPRIERASTYVRPARKPSTVTRTSRQSGAVIGGGKVGGYPLSIDKGITPHTPQPSSNAVSQCLAILSKLSRVERKQALDQLAFQLASSDDHGAARDKDMWSGAVHSALVASLGGGAGGLPGPMLFKRVLAATESWQYVEGFMTTSGFQTTLVRERSAVYQVLAKLLAEHALELNRKFGYPLTPKMLGNLTQHLPTLFEEAFPGYLAAGMGPVIIRSLVKGFQVPESDDD